jgi:sulfonate transport system permease protein
MSTRGESGRVADRITVAVQLAVVPVALIAVWEAAVRTGWWPRTLIAAPSEVASDFVRLTVNGDLARHAWVSLRRLAVGFALGGVVAVALGSLVGLSRAAERVAGPTILALAPVPPVAWVPLLIVLLGIDGAKLALIALGTFFIVYSGTVQGVRGADSRLVEVAYVYGKSGRSLVLEVLLPSALPSILYSLRVALGISWILLIAAEVIASSEGLGWLIWDSRNFSRPDDMIVGMIAVGALGKLSDDLLVRLQGWLLRWRPSFQGQ